MEKKSHSRASLSAASAAAGRLHHDAHRDVLRDRLAFAQKLLADGGDLRLRVAQLPHRGDHRQHDAQLAVDAGAEQRPQLGAEELRVPQREADGAQPQRRIGLVRAVPDGQLVAAQVQGADGDRPVLHLLEDGAVGAEVLLLGGQLLAVQVEELGAVEAHALGAVSQHARHLLGKLDVGADADAAAVQRLAPAGRAG